MTRRLCGGTGGAFRTTVDVRDGSALPGKKRVFLFSVDAGLVGRLMAYVANFRNVTQRWFDGFHRTSLIFQPGRSRLARCSAINLGRSKRGIVEKVEVVGTG